MYTLTGLVQQFLGVNVGFRQRFAETGVSSDLISTLYRSNFGEDSLAEPRRGEASSGTRTVASAARNVFSGRDWLTRQIPRFGFEDELEDSQVYRRCEDGECDRSFATSALRSHGWSALSLSNISSLSVIALPITSKDIEKIKNSDLSVSAQEIFSGMSPGGLPTIVDSNMEPPVSSPATPLKSIQKKQKVERETIFSRASIESMSERLSAISWRSRTRRASGSATSSLLYYGEYPDSVKGIDHIDYQESVRSISGDENFLKHHVPSNYDRADVNEANNRWCLLCRRKSEFFFWSTKNNSWVCEFCYVRRTA